MDINESDKDSLVSIARSADLCFKPWRHSIVDNSYPGEEHLSKTSLDLLLRIECRNKEGERFPTRDLEVEIFRSGEELSLILSWCNQPELPMLWHGKNCVWMDGNFGKRCAPPSEGVKLEALARRLRSLFVIFN